MQITFLHPRDSRTLEADVEPLTNGERCVRGLVESRFIEPPTRNRPYSLVVSRSQRQILPSTTMQQAGVVEGDSLAVLQMEQGA